MPYLLYSSSTCGLHSFLKRKGKLKKTTKKANPWLSIASFLLLVFTLFVFAFYLYLNLKITQINFLLEEQERKKAELEIRYQKLEAELAETLSLEKLRDPIEEFKLTKPSELHSLSIAKVPALSLKNNLSKLDSQ